MHDIMVSCILSFAFSMAQMDGPLTKSQCERVLVQLTKPFYPFGCPFWASAVATKKITFIDLIDPFFCLENLNVWFSVMVAIPI